MRVNIEELSKIIAILLLNLRNSKGNEVELKNDYYWDISSEQIYNPYDEPNDISLGQLSDDLNEVYRLLSSSNEAIPYDLKRIAEILKAISIENSTAF